METKKIYVNKNKLVKSHRKSQLLRKNEFSTDNVQFHGKCYGREVMS